MRRWLTRNGWRNPWLPICALAFAWLLAWLWGFFFKLGHTGSTVDAVLALPGPLRLAALAVLIGLSLYAYGAAFSLFSLGRLIRNTPTSRLDFAAQGLVELAGNADHFDGMGLRPPQSGMPCVWYSASTVWDDDSFWADHIGLKAGALSWLALHLRLLPGQTSRDSLILHTPHGDVVVDPAGAYVLPGKTRFGPGWREDLILPGQNLFVLGSLTTRYHDPASARQAAIDGRQQELLRAWKADPDNLRQRFGIQGPHISADEWERVRTAAFEAAVAEAGPPPAVDTDGEAHRTHVVRQPSGGPPFLIAAMQEAAVLRRLDAGAALNFAAGLASAAALISAVL